MLPQGSLAKFAAGAVAAVIGPAVFRPLLVGIIRAGYEARDRAADALVQAREEVRSVRDEVKAPRAGAPDAGALDAEVRKLRAEAAELRARLAARGE